MNPNIEYFRNSGYGMMIHFGLYSLLAGKWRWKKSSDYAEWIQSYFAIPISEYDRLASVFDPIYFDAEEIARLAKECGMGYIVVTTKHHDGFALFRSAVDGYNAADATPCGRDLIGELAEACRKYGLKLGFDYHNIGGFKPSKHGLYESACTLNHSWGFSYRDQDWITPEKLAENRKRLNSLGINYLVNLGPDGLGRIPGPSADILRRAAEIYGTI